MSQFANEARQSLSWKEEVSLRIAAHRRRQGTTVTAEPDAPKGAQFCTSGRAAEAAARVVARFANAPSYEEMLAEEQRTAVFATETATRAEPRLLAGTASLTFDSEASPAEKPWQPEGFLVDTQQWEWETGVGSGRQPEVKLTEVDAQEAEDTTESVWESETVQAPLDIVRQSYEIRWDADLPQRSVPPEAARATHEIGFSEARLEDWWTPVTSAQNEQASENAQASDGDEVVEPDQPIHGNLIEFPRELVATRKVRPRLAEGPYGEAGEPGAQLSIFEVDPGTISTQPEWAETASETAVPVSTGPEWSGIRLEEQLPEEPPYEVATAVETPALQPAPMNLRLMAAIVDGALISGALLAAAIIAAKNVRDLPSLREIELVGAAAFLAIGLLYETFFLTLSKVTPGMMYAGISLCTVDDQSPNRSRRLARFGALLLSLLPVGLGLVWAIFDEDHLSWHDRLSRTYLRKG